MKPSTRKTMAAERTAPAALRHLCHGILLAVLLSAATASAQQQGTVSGRIIGGPAKGTLEGATVVLMRFGANAQGKPEGGPIARQPAGANGSFTFRDVPIDLKARYQLGTRVDGRLVGSDRFTFSAGVFQKKVNITIPELVEERSALSIGQALYVVEPRIGKVWVTEVLHFQNRSRNLISTGDTPLELPLPPGAKEMQVISMELQQGNHEHIGAKLLILGQFRPGNSTIAFRYSLDATLGEFDMEKRYALPAANVLVLAERDRLEVGSDFLKPGASRKIDNTTYDVWSGADFAAGAPISFTVSGVPVAQWIYLFPAAVFFAVMAVVVLWFMRNRLGAVDSGAVG